MHGHQTLLQVRVFASANVTQPRVSTAPYSTADANFYRDIATVPCSFWDLRNGGTLHPHGHHCPHASGALAGVALCKNAKRFQLFKF